MNTSLKKFISSHANFSDTELETIANNFRRKIVKKNNYLLRQGDTCKEIVFVQRGCLRLFYIKDGWAKGIIIEDEDVNS